MGSKMEQLMEGEGRKLGTVQAQRHGSRKSRKGSERGKDTTTKAGAIIGPPVVGPGLATPASRVADPGAKRPLRIPTSSNPCKVCFLSSTTLAACGKGPFKVSSLTTKARPE